MHQKGLMDQRGDFACCGARVSLHAKERALVKGLPGAVSQTFPSLEVSHEEAQQADPTGADQRHHRGPVAGCLGIESGRGCGERSNGCRHDGAADDARYAQPEAVADQDPDSAGRVVTASATGGKKLDASYSNVSANRQENRPSKPGSLADLPKNSPGNW